MAGSVVIRGGGFFAYLAGVFVPALLVALGFSALMARGAWHVFWPLVLVALVYVAVGLSWWRQRITVSQDRLTFHYLVGQTTVDLAEIEAVHWRRVIPLMLGYFEHPKGRLQFVDKKGVRQDFSTLGFDPNDLEVLERALPGYTA